MGKILDCKVIRDTKLLEYKEYVKGKGINIGIISVGNDYSSKVYINNKIKVCTDVGINVTHLNLTSEGNVFKRVLDTINKLNNDESITGILLQLPIDSLTDAEVNDCLESIDSSKDIDCLTSFNTQYLSEGKLLPCTVQGVLDILKYHNIDVEGKSVVILGRSRLVGKPLSIVLDSLNATVTVLHSKTSRDTFEYQLKNADIVISAVGKVNLFSSQLLATNKDVYVIDVGINKKEDDTLVGDFDTQNTGDNIHYTTVPGGVGILTTANVVGNTIKLYKDNVVDTLVSDLLAVGLEPTKENIEAYEGSLLGYNDEASLDDDEYFEKVLNSADDMFISSF